MGAEFSTGRRLKLFAGYAGWSAGQLEGELERKAWLTHPATVDLVFDTDHDKLWQKVLNQKGWKYRIQAQMPYDPSVN